MEVSLDFVTRLAKDAGQILCERLDDVHTLDYKGPTNIATEVDKESEDFIVGRINKTFQGHTIVAEESGKTQGDRGKYWYIDPIDGTSNYARGLPMFAVSIAYEEDGKMQLGCIYDPVRKECYSAARGKGAWLNQKKIQVSRVNRLIEAMLVTGFPYDIRKEHNNLGNFSRIIKEVQVVRLLGSATLAQAYVAAGRLDAYWEIEGGAWDIAAGTLIIEEAGGKITALNGTADFMKPPYAILASNGLLHEKLLHYIK